MSRLFLLAGIALPALLTGGCGSESQTATSGEAASAAEIRGVTVPDVVGLNEGEAVRALDAAGLIANVRYDRDLPRTATVDHAVPASRTEVDQHSVVLLSIALPPRLPLPAPEQETEIEPLSRLVADHPAVFVGLYRDEGAVPHVVFGPGSDPAQWTDRLREAASGITYPEEGVGFRADRCSRTNASLLATADEITTNQDWTERRHLAFGAWAQPETCTVRIESDLLEPAEIEALVERYGTAISFDTSEGSHPVLLPLEPERD
jgi:PASTA domain-containing protein